MFKINIKELKWFIILFGFSYCLYYLISSKKIYLFIHPRLTIYMYFSLFIFIILTLLQIKKIFKVKNENMKAASSIFLLPLILIYLVNPQGINAQMVSQKGFSTNASLTGNLEANKTSAVKTKANADVDLQVSDDTMQGGNININEQNYSDVVNEITYNMNKYKGRTIKINGFVYTDNTFPKNTFVIGRMLIICCAADAEMVGLAFKMDKPVIQKDQWVEITGVLDTMANFDKEDTDNRTIPFIKVTAVKPIQKPSNPYVYLKASGN
ncbi:TIGR03943 family protein [Clostridium pasteurianum DSM 525 = ATCC 6013]|uniref:TIGR03943 family protein n=1 Tax=Clostridium pasteurianum DSM 525 = ATCC 6013 TaxID=1262449 RepID=A0A0H3J008_CLOPA|nr:TIGR03943 family protein [Clostridium pasteurianum]AJA46644.1 TIGR03943 family protein [Clostridium pasteurianum DSM 525 = ATCC 6013]AJA50632.1 TIGR03943 family protein [Clostridium pasteurianum DSM 525 = ATCC 6013]AOZ74055.1 hypothetical protein AQ983_02605 [Clostridium pasteurianum DSM 525 = ATCC 6013]AOZ77852.1 hypothetical protein AQ984_02605 [Clostridium pasteurianum]ELP61209.1 hypothetical protein F502_02100 [Clostridium pasteurianum DSM 525 = ATCC 6013]